MNIKLFYITGVEGCGHHALTPAIHASLTHNMNTEGSLIEINQPSIRLLHQAYCELWYQNHKDARARTAARQKIQNILQSLDQYATSQGKTQILLQDNSFPSVNYRTIDKQWDLAELAELVSPFADINFLGLYRDPIATTYSHKEWDGGLQGHAQIIATFLEYINGKLSELEKYNVRFLRYEDLVNRTQDLATPLSRYLGVSEDDMRSGLTTIRKRGKNWMQDMPPDEQTWIKAYFDDERISKWPLFLDKDKNILQ